MNKREEPEKDENRESQNITRHQTDNECTGSTNKRSSFLSSLSPLSLSFFLPFSLLIEVFSSFPLCPPTTRLMNCMRRNYAVTSTRIFARSFLPSDFFFGAGTGCDVRDNKARKFHGQRNKQPPLSVSCFLVENTLEGRVTLQSWITWQFNIFNN